MLQREVVREERANKLPHANSKPSVNASKKLMLPVLSLSG
jgi:hypothetical protein